MTPRTPRTTWAPRRDLDADVALAIREAKLASQMTWRQVAALVGCSHPHLVRVSKGTRVPSLPIARRLAEVLRLGDTTKELLIDEAESVTRRRR